jgi:hypothetical protein
LLVPIPYTYQYNVDRLEANLSSSLLYNLFLQPRLPATYYWVVISVLFSVIPIVAYSAVVLLNRRER